MEIHKPHAAKTWRGFFIDLGAIVAGILIALGPEQAVDALRHRIATARQPRRRRDLDAAGLRPRRPVPGDCLRPC